MPNNNNSVVDVMKCGVFMILTQGFGSGIDQNLTKNFYFFKFVIQFQDLANANEFQDLMITLMNFKT